MATYYGIGLMSGSSLDGVDLCFAEFTGDLDTDVWGYKIDHAFTVPYDTFMVGRLANATQISALELVQLQSDFSHFVGQCIQRFIDTKSLNPHFIASHGHTVFHQPDKLLSFQLGDGEIISTYVGCPVVCSFRSKDVALGGQGSPLIPCGEKFLFQQTDACLNLGGIANIGSQGGKGFDICPCNMILNQLASLHDSDLDCDRNGSIAASGQVIPDLLDRLNQLEFYHQAGPKSLGSEWVSENVKPLLKPEEHSVPDLLNTFVEHITDRVTQACQKVINKDTGTVLATGGGVFNCTLVEKLREKLSKHKIKIVETDNEIVEYKEALVIAFLGLRCLLGVENVFNGVTGSRSDSISGSIHHGFQGNRKPNLQDRFNFMIRKKSQGVNELRIITHN